MSYQPDHEPGTAAGLAPGGYQDQSDRALSRWYSAQSGQQTQPAPGRQEPQPSYRSSQPFDQRPPWNPYDQSDPGQRTGQLPQQDQAYQGQAPHPALQPYYGQQDFPQAQQPLRQYGPGLQDPQPSYTGQQNGHRGKASWPSRHKVLTGVIAVAALFIAGGIGAAAGKGSSAAPAPTVTVTEIQHEPQPAVTVTTTVTPTTNAQGEAIQISASGVYVVGQDIQPGTWHTSGSPTGSSCYYATLNSTDTNDISDNNNFTGPETVDVSGAKAFEINGDCTWQREG